MFEKINTFIENSVPKSNNKAKFKSQWATQAIARLSKKKRKIWDKYKGNKTNQNWLKYQQILDEFNSEKTKAIDNYEEKIASDKTVNPKQYYKYLSIKNKYKDNEIALNDEDVKIEADRKKCSDILNSFFGSVFTKGTSQMNNSIKSNRIQDDMPELIISKAEILKKLKKLNINKSTGPDGIPAILLKTCCNFFIQPLYLLFKSCMDSEKIPTILKSAMVIPIHKKGPKTDPNNYRPISLTPIIMKIFESLMLDQLIEHVNKNKIIKNQQHGFQKSKSTSTNMIDFWDDITDC